ncbi:hypothetical protein DFH09DRAFT_1115028 [Mycena vulgaris]|nr:hypothetical protein DFH09DRAFT_1115028 [Mycena vulgaris]
MWIHFETASEGLRALGAAARLGQSEAAYFSSDSEFLDAATYSRDQWTLESEDVEMGPLPPTRASVTSLPEPPLPCEAAPTTPAAPVAYAATATPAASSASTSPAAHAAPVVAIATPSPGPSTPTAPAALRRPVRAPPRAPRAMRMETTSSVAKLLLEERLSEPVAPLLAERLSNPATTALASRLSDPPTPSPLPPPLAQRMADSAPPLINRISGPEVEPPLKRQKLAASPTPPASSSASASSSVVPSASPSAAPSKRKRRGVRAGHLVKEQQVAREKRRVEAEALAAQAEATGDTSLLDWIPMLAVVAEEEALELGGIDGTAGWLHEGDDDDDDAPIAGPSRLR